MKITEQQLKNLIKEIVKESLLGFGLSNIGKKVKNELEKNGFEDFEIKESPSSSDIKILTANGDFDNIGKVLVKLARRDSNGNQPLISDIFRLPNNTGYKFRKNIGPILGTNGVSTYPGFMKL